MINSISLDNQSISASIISAQQSLNSKLNKIDGLLVEFNSDLNNINDTILYFVDELKVISSQVGTIVDGTIDIVECNQAYDSRWKIKLPDEMIDTIVKGLKGIKDSLDSIEIGDISAVCTNIYGTCTQGHSPSNPTGGQVCVDYSEPGSDSVTICSGGHCVSNFVSPGIECISDYCVMNFGDLFDLDGERCPTGHCGEYSTNLENLDTDTDCPSRYSDSGDDCASGFHLSDDETFCKTSYYHERLDGSKDACTSDYSTGGVLTDGNGPIDCPNGYQQITNNTDFTKECVSSYTEDSDSKSCTMFTNLEDNESCNSFSVDETSTNCTNSYEKGDATCASLYGKVEGGTESCLTTFSNDIGTCTGFSSDREGGDRTCVSDYSIGGGESCTSGYGVSGDIVICAQNVESGTCTNNVGQESCTFNAGCPSCYGSNFHQDCPQMGCWDISVPE